MSIQIETESPRGGVGVITVRGDMDVYTSPQLRQEILNALGRGLTHLVVDLDEVIHVDSTALGVLIGGKKRATEQNGDLTLICANKRTRRIFELTTLVRVFEIYDSQEEALARL
jgi:anti-sigma B factor antagonist